MSDARNYRLGFWLSIGAAFGFSAKAIFVKLAYLAPTVSPEAGHIAPITLLTMRLLFAAPIFGLVAMKSKSASALSTRQWSYLVIVGLAGYYGASILDFWGLMYISAGLERLILFTYPSLTLLLGFIFFDKKLEGKDFFALLVTYLGIAAAFAHDLNFAEDRSAIWLGAGLVFASSLAYAIYLIGGGELIAKLGSGRFTALAMAVATAATLLHYISTRPFLDVFQQTSYVYVIAGCMALFSTVIPVFMQSAAIKHVGAGRASMIGMLGPVLTIFLGWGLLDESISVAQCIGAALVIAGIALISKK